jgi:hypothetical protein
MANTSFTGKRASARTRTVDFRITSTALCRAELQRHDHLLNGYHKVHGSFQAGLHTGHDRPFIHSALWITRPLSVITRPPPRPALLECRESNPEPPGPEPGALPVELRSNDFLHFHFGYLGSTGDTSSLWLSRLTGECRERVSNPHDYEV